MRRFSSAWRAILLRKLYVRATLYSSNRLTHAPSSYSFSLLKKWFVIRYKINTTSTDSSQYIIQKVRTSRFKSPLYLFNCLGLLCKLGYQVQSGLKCSSDHSTLLRNYCFKLRLVSNARLARSTITDRTIVGSQSSMMTAHVSLGWKVSQLCLSLSWMLLSMQVDISVTWEYNTDFVQFYLTLLFVMPLRSK